MKKFIFPVVILVLVGVLVMGILAFTGVEPFESAAGKIFRSAEEKIPALAIVRVEKISVGTNGLIVSLIPNTDAEPDYKYEVQLYEKGEPRDSAMVSWNQPEINVSKPKTVMFKLTKEEMTAYFGADVSHIFKAYVRE
jgi:hypothetical protein